MHENIQNTGKQTNKWMHVHSRWTQVNLILLDKHKEAPKKELTAEIQEYIIFNKTQNAFPFINSFISNADIQNYLFESITFHRKWLETNYNFVEQKKNDGILGHLAMANIAVKTPQQYAFNSAIPTNKKRHKQKKLDAINVYVMY